MADGQPDCECCGRCGGPAAAARVAHRRYYRSALFTPAPRHPQAGDAGDTGPDPAPGPLAGIVFGTVLDVSPQVLVVTGTGSQRRTFALGPEARVWRGQTVGPTSIRADDRIILRTLPGRHNVADRVWAGIGRVTGTIAEAGRDYLVVDEGATRRPREVVIAARARSRIQVRFPQLLPGHLIDVIGVRRAGVLEALIPATAQPPAFRPEQVPPAAAWTARPDSFRGSATWHEPATPGESAEGVAYPAVDPAANCPEAASGGHRPPSGGLPYLSVGSVLQVHNECTGASAALPVTTCGIVAGLFSDRCLACGTSPRSRVADLTLASFVRLGGEPERGCFNATITVGW